MFKLEPTAISDLDEQEVACELANMVGGNLKSILPGPASLSLPRFVGASQDLNSSTPRVNDHTTTLVAAEGQVNVAFLLGG